MKEQMKHVFKSTAWGNVEDLSTQLIAHSGTIYPLLVLPKTFPRRVWKVKPEIIKELNKIFDKSVMPAPCAINVQYINTVWVSIEPEAYINVKYDEYHNLTDCTVFCPGKPLEDGERPLIYSSASEAVFNHAVSVIKNKVKPVKGNIPLIRKRWAFNNGIWTFIVHSLDYGKEYQLEVKPYTPTFKTGEFPESIQEFIVKELVNPKDYEFSYYWDCTREPI